MNIKLDDRIQYFTKDTLVVLSGGQDSATCLAYTMAYIKDYNSKALEINKANIYTISFDYGQRHRTELTMSAYLSKMAGAKQHFELPINTFEHIGDSALIKSSGNISASHRATDKLPASFVPGRNYIFLGYAAAMAFKLGIHNLVTGVCQTDFSGYPDCRADTITAIQWALSLSMDWSFSIITPLMNKSKAETVKWMEELGCLGWYAFTQTCYEGKRPPCGDCPACKLRAKGFAEAGIEDPLIRYCKEGE